MAARDLCTN